MKKSEFKQLIREMLKEELSRINLKESAEQASELEATLSKAFNRGENVFVSTPPGMATITRICNWCETSGIPYALVNARDTDIMANLDLHAETLSAAAGGLLIVDEYGRANTRTRAMLLTIINEHAYGQVASVAVSPMKGYGYPIDDVNDAELNKFDYQFTVYPNESLKEFMDANINLDARGFGGKDNNVSVLGGKVPFGESANVDGELEEGIFGGNDYKDKDFLVYRGQGKDEVIAIGKRNGSDHNLYNYKQAHIEKNGSKTSDYAIVASTKPAIKKYKKSLKTADDVSTKLPFWVQKYVTADAEKRTQDFRNAEAQKEREAKARQEAERDRYRNRKEHNPDDDYVYIKGNGTGTYKYREDLDEAAFSGGMAGDNSINGGKVGGMGASTQPDHKTYLNRIKAKNPDLVDIITIKAKDLKPNMMTQAGQIKTAEVKYSGYHSKDMVYVMHTNGWDYFKELDADMEVMADPDDKSKPFTGAWKEILSRGLKESLRREPLTVDNIFENLY